MGNLGDFYSKYDNVQSGGGGPLPAGNYPVFIEAAEAKPTKNDPQQGYLELKLKVMDGEYKNRYAPSIRLNLWNASDKAREIAETELKNVTMATGAGRIDDTSQLVGKTMQITVRPQKNDPSYSESVYPSPIQHHAPAQNQAPQGGGFNQTPQGGGFNQAPQGGGFNQGPQGGAQPAFLQSNAPQGGGFNQAPQQDQTPAYIPGARP